MKGRLKLLIILKNILIGRYKVSRVRLVHSLLMIKGPLHYLKKGEITFIITMIIRQMKKINKNQKKC